MLRRLTPVCLVVLLLGGCGSGTETPSSSGAGEDRSTATSAPASTDPSESLSPDASETAGAEVPDTLRWQARTVDESPFDAATLAGKPTVLWFWAPWCPTCRGQIPQVQGLADRYGDRVNVVGVGSLDDTEAIVGFARDVPGVTHLTDPDGAVWRRFGVTEQSSFVVLDADGEQAFEAGYGGASDLEAQVERLVD